MEKKSILIWVGVAVIMIAILLLLTMTGPGSGYVPNSGGGASTNTSSGVAVATPTSPTRSPVPANVIAPNEGATDVLSNVAVPKSEASANPAGTGQYKNFAITVAEGEFSPNTIAVNIGDTVNIEVSAIGRSYDFTQPDYGIKAEIPAGTTKQIQFSATAGGKFLFYCASCGGPTQGPSGYLIVTK